ncbi:MAG TPA: glycosyltransferase [Chitinophagaceae bacterium]|nr:glycosyltransferase [Chitinophagaceae bacterium]
MAKFLFFPYSNQLGTTIPSVTLANLLRDHGHIVYYASHGKYTHILKEKGFEVFPITEISYLQYRRHVDENNVDFYQTSLIHHFIDKELDLIREVDPDIIVSNNRPTIKISAQLAGKKLVTIVIPALTRFYYHDYFIPENHFLATLYPLGDVNQITPPAFRRFAFFMTMKQWGKNFNKVLREFNLPKMTDFLGVYEGDVILINQSYELAAFTNLPSNYFHLEQNLGSTFGHQHPWADELDVHRKKGRKVIFVSMGSSSLKSYPLVMQAIKQLVDNDERFVLVSNHVGLANHQEISDRIYLEPFINSSQILPKVDLVITHGGINTLSECMLQGIPIIGVPEQGEQMWNLKYAEHLGIGKMVSKFQLEKDPSLITQAIVELAENPNYALKIKEFALLSASRKGSKSQNELIYQQIEKLLP